MKKIVVNGKLLTQRVTGVQRYALEVLQALDAFIEKGSIQLALPPDVIDVPCYKNIEVVKVGRLTNRLWEQISFPKYLFSQKAIALNLCNVSPLLAPGVVCIHDVKVKATPQYFSKSFLWYYWLLLANATRRGKAIVTVSDFSKSEIIKYYPAAADKITVIPNAWQHYQTTQYDEDALHKYALEKKNYCFSVSSLEPNKNLLWVARAAQKNPRIIFAVAGSMNDKVFANGLGFELPSNMKLLGYVSDEEAKTLMRDCRAFLFPSFYEGFGIPPLEAMSAGAKKIVVSDTTVMHEVFEASVCYINPHCADIDLEELLDGKEQEKDEILNKYTWENSARKMLLVLENL